MTAFRRADSESVKQFFSSTVDRFRGAYGKYVQPHPRQCVIFCTTNKRQYLYDLTGNRRFWPVWINQRILLDWLKKYRDRLFAEALIAYRRGDRYFPTKEEEDEFFVPEQMLRLADTSVQSRLWELLTREGAAAQEGRSTMDLTRHCKFVTLHQLVAVLGSDAAKSTATLENQVRSWLERSRAGGDSRRPRSGRR
jgi:predicted P-loop ATPase